jgi:aspartokinase-like uncharacterized kinase
MLTVVKVGGSFARDARLAEVAAALADGGGSTIVVPGGGPFADGVRREQERIGYDDRIAHKMALLAMAQFGTILVGMNPQRFVPATGPEGIRKAIADARIPVWLPFGLLGGHHHIPESWDVTADSLAAWLAGQIKAERLIFLKRKAARTDRLADLVAAGMLDPFVPNLLAGGSIPAFVCGPRDLGRLASALAGGEEIGRRVLAD